MNSKPKNVKTEENTVNELNGENYLSIFPQK